MIGQRSCSPPNKVIMTFNDGGWLLVLRLDKFILQHCHTRDSFILKSLKTRVEGFLTDETRHKGVVRYDQYVISSTFSAPPPPPPPTKTISVTQGSVTSPYPFKVLAQGHDNLNLLANKASSKYHILHNLQRIVFLPVWWKVSALKINLVPGHQIERFLLCHLKRPRYEERLSLEN